MESRYLIIYSVILAVLGCIVVAFSPASRKSLSGFVFILLNAIITSVSAVSSLAGKTQQFTVSGGQVFGDVSVAVDPLSAWFILVINLTCTFGAWYGIRYMRSYVSQENNLSIHWASFILFHMSMILVCAVQHSLAFLVVWEVMTVTSFLLMMFDHQRFQTLNAGITYLVQMHIAVVFLTVAFIWASLSEGNFTFEGIASCFRGPHSAWLFLLFFVGFGIKSGFVPLHTWLPHAHPAAPSHISGVMSGVMVKMGIYGILRTGGWLIGDLLMVGAAILVVSVVTAFYGILSGAIHRDYKRILAFSTIENVGLIGLGIGMGFIGKGSGNSLLAVIGFSAALLHVLNHALNKSLLFFSAGNIFQLTHTRNMEHLGGLIRRAPLTTFFFLCGSMAICGLPPFSGFISKFLLFTGLLEGIRTADFRMNILMLSAMAGLALISGATLLAFAKSFSIMFLGQARQGGAHPKQEYGGAGHAPLFVILFFLLFIGISPAIVWLSMKNTVQYFVEAPVVAISLAGSLGAIREAGLASVVFIVFTAGIYAFRSQIMLKKIVRYGPTWRCGYPTPNSKMQYTGKSFSKTLAKLFSFITGEEKKYREIETHTVFPASRTYRSSYPEFFEKNVLNKVVNLLLNFMNYFSFLQHGKVQFYILYGLVFIIALLFASFLNVIK